MTMVKHGHGQHVFRIKDQQCWLYQIKFIVIMRRLTNLYSHRIGQIVNQFPTKSIIISFLILVLSKPVGFLPAYLVLGHTALGVLFIHHRSLGTVAPWHALQRTHLTGALVRTSRSTFVPRLPFGASRRTWPVWTWKATIEWIIILLNGIFEFLTMMMWAIGTKLELLTGLDDWLVGTNGHTEQAQTE